MSLRILSHIPAINETGVFRNQPVSVTFNKQIEPTSIDNTTFSVNDHANFTAVPGTYSMGFNSNGSGVTAIFTPSVNMTSNTQYDVFVYAKPDSILSVSNDELDDFYYYTFTTGKQVIDDVSGSGVLPSGAAIPVFSGTLSGIPASVSGSITSFNVYSTEPKNHTPNVSNSLADVRVIFTGTVSTSVSNMSGYVTIEESPVLQ